MCMSTAMVMAPLLQLRSLLLRRLLLLRLLLLRLLLCLGLR